ncbi:MAG: hypothetical protein WC795_02980 [Candidatus Paceibacterota bacterium]|jgi:hypothetical protein
MDYDKILALIKRIRVRDGKLFTISEVNFHLLTMDGPSEKDDAFYSCSTQIKGFFDIYLNILQEKEEISRCLFHEIVEVLWVVSGEDTKDAHLIALEEEERYFGKRKVNLDNVISK